jgi:hypothetical protein
MPDMGMPHALFLLMAVNVCFDLYLWQRFYTLLKTQHHSSWEALGKPSLFDDRSVHSILPSRVFIWKGVYRALDDATLNRIALMLKSVEVAAAILFIAAIVVYFAAS